MVNWPNLQEKHRKTYQKRFRFLKTRDEPAEPHSAFDSDSANHHLINRISLGKAYYFCVRSINLTWPTPACFQRPLQMHQRRLLARLQLRLHRQSERSVICLHIILSINDSLGCIKLSCRSGKSACRSSNPSPILKWTYITIRMRQLE